MPFNTNQQRDGARAWTLKNSKKFWPGCALQPCCPGLGSPSQERRAGEVQASQAPAAPNLLKRKPERVGEEGPNPAQLALEKRARKRLRVTEMPPGPDRVAHKSRRKLQARAAEAGPSSSAGCTGTPFQRTVFIEEEIGVYLFNLVFQHDCYSWPCFILPPDQMTKDLTSASRDYGQD
jgi:hypothetical protein